MSNERIDLTQFESKHSTELYQRIQDYIRGDDYPDEIPLRIMGLYSELIAELRRCYEKLDELEQEPRVTIDEWDKKGPCVTVQYNGREYVGTLEEWSE